MTTAATLTDQQVAANYQQFVKALTELTRQYGIALQCVGGVYIADQAGEFKDLSYIADISSGDLMPVWPRDWY
jgi:hypothetical protein